MTTETIPAEAVADYYKNVGDLFEIIAKTEERATGVFDASLNRKQAKALANRGYSLKPGTVETAEGAVFDILITTENEATGVFRAAIARKTAKELVEAGCSL
jgi:hypothetical protein